MLEEFAQKKTQVAAGLGRLVGVAESIGAEALAQRLKSQVIGKLEADQFHLVVMGEFNHGKTTFVNALIEQALLPTGVTPTTAAIHHLVYADEAAATLVSSGGTRTALEVSALADYASESGGDGDEIEYIEVALPAEMLKDGIVLVDTPGVNDLSLSRAEITYGYIPRSDAVLFLIDAGQPMKESEREFLQTQLIERSRDKIIFVVNKSDIWSPAEKDEALEYIEGQLKGLVEEPTVFAVSASEALAGRDGGLEPLRAHVAKFLADQRGRLMLSNALGEGLSAAKVAARAIDARRRASTMNLDALKSRIDRLEADLVGQTAAVHERQLIIREECGSIKAWAKRDLDRFCDDLIAKLPDLLETASGDDVRQHLGAFIESAFRDWATRETGEIAAALEKLAERMVALVKDDAHEVGQRVSAAMGGELQTPDVEVDTFAYDLGIFAMLSLGLGIVFANAMLGGILLVAAPALAMWQRGRTEREVRKRALELAPQALREAARKVGPKIDEMVDEFGQRLDHWVVTCGEELHREVLDVLRGTEAARRSGQLSAESLSEACDAGVAKLEAVEAELAELRAALATPEEAKRESSEPAEAHAPAPPA